MPKVLKSSNVVIDRDNRVFIKTLDFNVVDKEKNNSVTTIGEIESSETEMQYLKKSIIQDAYDMSDKLKKEAKQEADKILSEAKQEADDLKEQIRLESEKTGYDEGYKKGLTDSEALIEEARLELKHAQDEKFKIIRNAEAELIELMMNVLDKLMCKSIKINKDVILCLIEQGLNGATLLDSVNIRVSSNDYSKVIENKENILSKLNATTNIEIIKDFSLGEMDCIIETPFGNIDSSLKNQFDSLKKDLYYLLEMGETVGNN